MKEVKAGNSTVLMSDSLVDKINIEQFYENPKDEGDIFAQIFLDDDSIRCIVNKFKIENSLLKLNFFCDLKSVYSFVSSKEISEITFFIKGNERPAMIYKNTNIISKSVKSCPDSVHECDLVVTIHNT